MSTGETDFQGLSWAQVQKILRAAVGLKYQIMADNAVYLLTPTEEQPVLQRDALVKVAALEVILDAHPWAAKDVIAQQKAP